MSVSRRAARGLFAFAAFVLVSRAIVCAGQTFTVSVPDRSPNMPIGAVRITLQTSGDPTGGTLGIAASTFNLSDSTQISGTDFVKFKKVASANAVEILLTLNSNMNTPGNYCVKSGTATFPQARTMTFTPPGGVTVTGYRLTSYTALSENECTCAVRRAQTSPVTWSTPPPGTDGGRHGLDVVLVLDRSGSMGDPADGAPPNSDPKLDLLKWSVGQFIDAWKVEASGVPDDRLAVVWFETTATIGSGFVARSVPNGWDGIKTAVNAQTTANSTALGDGISKAIQLWKANPQNDAHIVLMTNGMQNEGKEIKPGNQVGLPSPDEACFDLDQSAYVILHSECIPVQTIGVGAPGNVQTDLLDKVALQTGGTAGVTVGDKIDLTFLTSLVNILKGNTMSIVGQFADTLPQLAPSNPPRSVEVDGTVKQLVAVVGWRTREAGLDLMFQDPNGATVAAVKRADNSFYTIQTVDLPSSGPAGTWKVTVVRKPGSRVAIPYHISFYTLEGRVEFRAGFAKVTHHAGDPLDVEVEISQDHKPLTGLGGGITALPYVPPQPIGDILHNKTVSPSVLSTDPPGFTVDKVGAANGPYLRKMHALIANEGLLGEVTPVAAPPPLVLHDDGIAPDAHANDGIYSGRLTNTSTPGSYGFDIQVDIKSPATGQITRDEHLATVLSIKADPDNSTITPGGSPGAATRTVTIEPVDFNGHYLGPGYENDLHVASPNGTVASIIDAQAIGRYVVTLTGVTVPDPILHVTVNGDPLYDGPLSKAGHFKRTAVFAGAGANIPQGTFNDVYDGRFSLQAGAEYMLTKQVSVEGVFDYHHFAAPSASLNVYDIAARAKVYAPMANPRVAAFGGVGSYTFSANGGTHAGTEAGAVAEFKLKPQWSVEGTYTFHHVSTPVNATIFSTIEGGLRFRF